MGNRHPVFSHKIFFNFCGKGDVFITDIFGKIGEKTMVSKEVHVCVIKLQGTFRYLRAGAGKPNGKCGQL